MRSLTLATVISGRRTTAWPACRCARAQSVATRSPAAGTPVPIPRPASAPRGAADDLLMIGSDPRVFM
jgi:hypothetical protein